MKMWGPIATLLSLLVCSYLIVFVYKIDAEVERQFNEQRLRYAVDYATEAGFRAAMSSDDLGIDYTDMTDVKVSPTNALRTFESLICLSYDMPISDENLAYIESFIPTAIMACSDGYYVAKTTESDVDVNDGYLGGNFGLKWGMKIPYSIKRADKDYVAFSMSGLPLYRVRESGDGLIVETLDPSDPDNLSPLFDESMLSERLNKEVNLAVRLRNEQFSAKDGNLDLFFVPSDFSTVANNAIKSPSFVAMLQNVDFAGSQKLSLISVGGVKVIKKNLVVGFRLDYFDEQYGLRSGVYYYCYSSKLPDKLSKYATMYFSSMSEAAKLGYIPAVSIMGTTTN